MEYLPYRVSTNIDSNDPKAAIYKKLGATIVVR